MLMRPNKAATAVFGSNRVLSLSEHASLVTP